MSLITSASRQLGLFDSTPIDGPDRTSLRPAEQLRLFAEAGPDCPEPRLLTTEASGPELDGPAGRYERHDARLARRQERRPPRTYFALEMARERRMGPW